MAGLLIGLQPTPHASLWTLTSLGDAPRVEATLVPRTPLLLLGWGAGIACFAWGLLLLRGTLAQQLAFVFGVMIIATLAPLLLPVLAEIGELFDGACFGAALCGLWYGVAAWWRTLAESSRAGCQSILGRFAWLLGAHECVALFAVCRYRIYERTRACRASGNEIIYA